MNVLVEITKQNIDAVCELYGIAEDKVEYCIENAASCDWVDGAGGAIYMFDIWGNEPLSVELGQVGASELFQGWLPQIVDALMDKERAVTLWKMYFEDMSSWDTEYGDDLIAEFVGVVDMDKIHLALAEGNGAVIKSVAYVESLECELDLLRLRLTPEQKFDHAYGMLEAVAA